MSDLPPAIKTSLVGRPAYEPDMEQERPPPEGIALPSGCVRKLNIPGSMCEMECAGRQRDGGCLADLVQAREPGSWSMTLDSDGYWVIG